MSVSLRGTDPSTALRAGWVRPLKNKSGRATQNFMSVPALKLVIQTNAPSKAALPPLTFRNMCREWCRHWL